ncbi:MAG TPA: hypothetical protein VGJ29_01920 [Vicinamibacterales bacterium]|jgi:hypothetical protein
MGLLDNLTGMLSQYASGAAPSGDAGAHFEQVAQSVDSGTVAQGIAAVLRSDQTPPFAQLASQLFASGSSAQKMAMINTLLSSVSPEQRSQLSALIPGLGAASAVTSVQAAAVSPTALQTLAQHAEQHDGGIVDKMSTLYAAHPTLVKTLGSAAMMIAMRKIAEGHQNA